MKPSPLNFLQGVRKLDRRTFNRACAAFGLAFLVMTIGWKMVHYHRAGLPQFQDFPQYFMGAVVAREGAWDDLYPIPNPNAKTNPGFVENSDLRPGGRALSVREGVPLDAVRFMQPPPTAILLLPLAWMPFTVSHWAWCGLLVLGAWGIALHAGRIVELCLGRASRWSGLVVLLICLSPQAHRWVRVSNMSILIGWLIGVCVIELIRRDGFRGGVALLVGSVMKYAPIVLAPMYVVLGRWRSVAWAWGVGLALLGLSLLWQGTGPYKVYIGEISPTLARTSAIPENSALQAVLLRSMGRTEADGLPIWIGRALRTVQWALLALILWLIWRRRGAFGATEIVAGCLALMAWLLVFSPIFWEHYQAYLAPFWGWLIVQGIRGGWKRWAAALSIGLSYAPWTLVAGQLFGATLPEVVGASLLWSTLIMLLLALITLSNRGREMRVTAAAGGRNAG
jgi:hypothetical protein